MKILKRTAAGAAALGAFASILGVALSWPIRTLVLGGIKDDYWAWGLSVVIAVILAAALSFGYGWLAEYFGARKVGAITDRTRKDLQRVQSSIARFQGECTTRMDADTARNMNVLWDEILALSDLSRADTELESYFSTTGKCAGLRAARRAVREGMLQVGKILTHKRKNPQETLWRANEVAEDLTARHIPHLEQALGEVGTE